MRVVSVILSWSAFTYVGLDKIVPKHLPLLLRHSVLQSQEFISMRNKGADKLWVVIGTNKTFENSLQYFTGDGKH